MLFSDLFHSPTALATLPLAMQFSSVIWGILAVVLIITCLVLILIILLQDPKSAGLTSAFGGGGGDSLLGAQAQRGVSRFTAILTTLFIVICVALVLIENKWVPSSVGSVGASGIETTNAYEDGAVGNAYEDGAVGESFVPIDPDVDGTAPAGGGAPATPPVSGNGGNTPPPPTPPSGQ